MSTHSAAHQNTLIRSDMLKAVVDWLTAFVTAKAVEGRVTDLLVNKALIYTIGTLPTYGALGDMSATEFRQSLVECGVRIPSNTDRVVNSFVRAWGPDASACDTCKLLAFVADGAGVQGGVPLTPCGFCVSGTIVAAKPIATTMQSWVTLNNVSADSKYDTSTGAKIPLTEDEILPLVHPNMSKLLSKYDATATAWATYLLHGGGAREFGFSANGPRSAPVVVALLGDDLTTRYEERFLRKQIALALAPLAMKSPDEYVAFAVKPAKRSSRALFDAMNGLLPSQFNKLLFMLNVPLADIHGAAAPQAARAMDVIQWAESRGHIDELNDELSRMCPALGRAS
jgi:hypothetical protein